MLETLNHLIGTPRQRVRTRRIRIRLRQRAAGAAARQQPLLGRAMMRGRAVT